MITGGTGMIGTALSRHLLQQGYDVIILSRNPIETASVYKTTYQQNSFRPSGKIYYAKWDTEKMVIDHEALNQADYIVHLAGEGVAKKRWTKKRKEEIRVSRTKSSELLFQCLTNQPNKVKAVVSASAIGWYGPDTESSLTNGFTETDPFDPSYSTSLAEQFLKDIFPVDSEFDYALNKFSLILEGVNREQTITFNYGFTASNGKSFLMERINNLLGDYSNTFPVNMLTNKMKAAGDANSTLIEFKNKIALVFSKLIVSLLDMYQQVIFSNSLFIVSARVFKFLHFDATFVSSAKATLKSLLD